MIISVIEGVITALVITIIIATTLFAASQVANLNTTGG